MYARCMTLDNHFLTYQYKCFIAITVAQPPKCSQWASAKMQRSSGWNEGYISADTLFQYFLPDYPCSVPSVSPAAGWSSKDSSCLKFLSVSCEDSWSHKPCGASIPNALFFHKPESSGGCLSALVAQLTSFAGAGNIFRECRGIWWKWG